MRDLTICVGQVFQSYGAFPVKFTAKVRDLEPTPQPPPRNAFALMLSSSVGMSSPSHLPPRDGDPRNGVGRLYNEILSYAKEKKCGFAASVTSVPAQKRAIRDVAKIFFELTSFEEALYNSSYPASCKPPVEFKRFCGFSQALFSTSHKKKPVLKRESLDDVVKDLGSLKVDNPSFNHSSWQPLMYIIDGLFSSMQQRIKYYKRQAEEAAARRASDPAAFLSNEKVNIMKYEPLPRQALVSEEYVEIQRVLEEENCDYCPLSLEEDIQPLSSMERSRFIKGIALKFPVMVIACIIGGPYPNLYWVMRVPALHGNLPPDHETKICEATRLCTSQVDVVLQRSVTRQLRRRAAALLPGTAPHIIRELLRVIFGDTAAPATSAEAKVDARVRLSIESDGELIADFRKYNGPERAKRLEKFWEVLKAVLGEKDQAADERRRGQPGAGIIGSSIISIPILINEVEKRMMELYGGKQQLVAARHDIPSIQWVALNFMPKNRKDHRQLHYTGQFEVVYKIQKRTLRCDHPDAHYGNALQRYAREFALRLGNSKCIFISADDKARVEIGPPGVYHQSGVRNRRVPTVASEELNASDHDFDGSSITPSVYLIHDLDEGKEGNWHRGDVYVGLKDSVFQRSTSLRHAEELIRLVSPVIKPTQTVMMVLTDGGPDRNLERASIEASWLAVARELDLDGLIVMRTVPKLSWRNPVERVMSVLNLGLQNLAISRPAMPDNFEEKMTRCNSMAQIRELASTDGLQDAFMKSIGEVKGQIEERFKRLRWSGREIRVYAAGERKDMDDVSKLFTDLDVDHFKERSVGIENLKKQDIVGSRMVTSIIANHVSRSAYCWQFWKKQYCECEACAADYIGPLRMDEEEFAALHKLPLPVPRVSVDEELQYKKFDEVFGSEPDASHRPGTGKVRGRKGTAKKGGPGVGQRCSRRSNVYSQTSVRGFVTCGLCNKQRCIYALDRGFSRNACRKMKLDAELETMDYTCGGELFEEGNTFANKLCVKEELCCSSDMESQFFLCNVAGRNLNVCSICGMDETTLVEPPSELLELHCSAFPICQTCVDSKKTWLTSRKKSHGAAVQKKRKRQEATAAHRQHSQRDESEEAATDSDTDSDDNIPFEDAEDNLIGESNDELQVESREGE